MHVWARQELSTDAGSRRHLPGTHPMSLTAMHSVDHHSLIRGNVCVTDGAHSKCTYGHDRKLSTVISQGLTPCPVTGGASILDSEGLRPPNVHLCLPVHNCALPTYIFSIMLWRLGGMRTVPLQWSLVCPTLTPAEHPWPVAVNQLHSEVNTRQHLT